MFDISKTPLGMRMESEVIHNAFRQESPYCIYTIVKASVDSYAAAGDTQSFTDMTRPSRRLVRSVLVT